MSFAGAGPVRSAAQQDESVGGGEIGESLHRAGNGTAGLVLHDPVVPSRQPSLMPVNASSMRKGPPVVDPMSGTSDLRDLNFSAARGRSRRVVHADLDGTTPMPVSLLDAVTSPRTFPVNLAAVRAGVFQVSPHCQLAASGRHGLFRGLRTPCPAAGTSSVTHRHGFRSDRLSCRRTRYGGSACEKGE